MNLFKSVFTFIIDGFKHFILTGYAEPVIYLFLCSCVLLFVVKVFRK